MKTKIKTFEDACKALKLNPPSVLPYKKPEGNDEEVLNAYAKLRIIAKALRGKWQPDWNNSSQWKYYPWFRHQPGVGFSCYGYVYGYSASFVGSRLCFPTREMAEYFGTQFIDIHQIVLTK